MEDIQCMNLSQSNNRMCNTNNICEDVSIPEPTPIPNVISNEEKNKDIQESQGQSNEEEKPFNYELIIGIIITIVLLILVILFFKRRRR